MLRAAWRVLSSIRTPARAQAPVLGLPGGGCARLPSDRPGLLSTPRGLVLHATREYAIQKPVTSKYLLDVILYRAMDQTEGFKGSQTQSIYQRIHPFQPSREDDPPPSTLLKDYQNIPGIEKVDDVVKRLLSLEMANKKEMLKIKKEQLINRIVANPEDNSSLEARIVALTVKIQSYEEHMQKHRKDKTHKRYLLMSIDQRKKMLKNLRQTNYDVFEKTCKELQIEYTCPPLHNRKPHRRMAAKKALCLQVFQEAQKLKKQRRALKAAAAAQKQEQRGPKSPSKAEPETVNSNQ